MPEILSYEDATGGSAPPTDAWQDMVVASANAHGVDPELLHRQVVAESNGNAKAIGPVTKSGERAVGISQFMPATADRFGINPKDPKQSIDGQARYMKILLAQFDGDPEKAAAGYNWGEGNVHKAVVKYGEDWKAHIPKETKDYVAKVAPADRPGPTLQAAAALKPEGNVLSYEDVVGAAPTTKPDFLSGVLQNPSGKSKKLITKEGEFGVMGPEASDAAAVINSAKRGLMTLPGLPADIANALPTMPEGGFGDPVTIAISLLQKGNREEEGKGPIGGASYLAQKTLGYDPTMRKEPFLSDIAEFAASMVNPFGVASKGSALIKEGAAAIRGVPGALPAAAGMLKEAIGDTARTLFQATGAVSAGEFAKQSGAGPVGTAAAELASIPITSFAAKWPAAVGKVATASGRADISAEGKRFNESVADILGPSIKRSAEQKIAKNILLTGEDATDASKAAGFNVIESVDLQNKMNAALKARDEGHITLSAGRASNSPALVADELAARSSTNASLAAAQQENLRNSEAVSSYILQGAEAPGLPSRKVVIDREINKLNAAREALIKRGEETQAQMAKVVEPLMPATTAEERGARLVELRGQAKVQQDVVKNALYRVAQNEADKAGALFRTEGISAKADELLANPILAYDPTNAPTVVSRIRAMKAPEATPSGILDANGMPMPTTMSPPPPTPFKDIQALRTAVNQDIAVELASTNPNKRFRLRALTEMKNEIDGAIAESPYDAVKQAYTAATDYYRDTYSPMFNKGVNAKLAMQDSLGEQRVFNEKILDEYAKNPTNVNNFLRLFGKNPEALALMEDHLAAKFANAPGVLKSGILDPVAAQRWFDRNAPVLAKLDAAGVKSLRELSTTAKQAQYLADRQAAILTSEKEMANSKLANLLGVKDPNAIVVAAMKDPEAMGRLTKSLGQEGSKALASSVMREAAESFTYAPEMNKLGINTQIMGTWLNANRTGLRIMFRAAYGPQEGAAHLTRLEDAYKMMAIQERVDIPRMKTAASEIGKDQLLQKVGVSTRTFFNLMRAVVGGRTSEADAALVLGGQMGSTYLNKTYNQLMQSIASDPEGSKQLLILAKGGGTKGLSKAESVAQGKAIGALLAKGGYYWVGGKYYGPALKSMVPAVVHQGLMDQQDQRATSAPNQ